MSNIIIYIFIYFFLCKLCCTWKFINCNMIKIFHIYFEGKKNISQFFFFFLEIFIFFLFLISLILILLKFFFFIFKEKKIFYNFFFFSWKIVFFISIFITLQLYQQKLSNIIRKFS